MKRTINVIGTLILILTLFGCSSFNEAQNLPGFTEIDVKDLTQQETLQSDLHRTLCKANDTDQEIITIASWNIQIFGKTKAGKPEVMSVIAQTITQFDIVAIQEIRDKSGTAIKELERQVDALGTDYDVIIGPRLGRTSSKEQYAFIYRSDKLIAGYSYTYDDESDAFHREPFVAEFKTKNDGFDFVLVSIHTDPDTATEEINALHDVITQAKALTGEPDIIALGDYNSDCKYHDEQDRGQLSETEYLWAIPDSADTNLAKSDCTYDRIVMTRQETKNDFTGTAGVYRFDTAFGLNPEQAKRVSDHYPVFAVFHVGKDTD